jgi:cytochrome b subunit of formate dehydrogenase
MSKNKEIQKTNTLSRWFGDHKTAWSIISVATFLLIISGIFMYKKLHNTKIELESCRSSCSS